jgi:hypothetical protein
VLRFCIVFFSVVVWWCCGKNADLLQLMARLMQSIADAAFCAQSTGVCVVVPINAILSQIPMPLLSVDWTSGVLFSCTKSIIVLSLFQVLEVKTLEGLGTTLDVVLVTLLDSSSHFLHLCHSFRCWRCRQWRAWAWLLMWCGHSSGCSLTLLS